MGRDFQSFGRWNYDRCRPGPMRVTLDIESGAVTRLRTQVGGTWFSTSGKVTDLGVADPREASAYFFSLVPKLEGNSGKDRLLIPAVLAADADVIQPLLALARNTDRADHTRRAAIMWLGIVGDKTIVPALVQFARADDSGEKNGKSGLSGTALICSVGGHKLAHLGGMDQSAGPPPQLKAARRGAGGDDQPAIRRK
jgi:hypothetical protein